MKAPTEPGCGHHTAATDGPDRLLTINEVADWIGVSVSTLYQHSYQSKGPNRLKIGNALRYKPCCVAAWIDDQMVKSND